MTWAGWEATWRVHARSRAFGQRVQEAVRCVQAHAHRRLFVGLSGGKDSGALAAVVRLAGASHLPAVHAAAAFDLPGMVETAIAQAHAADLALDVVAPAQDGWALLEELHRQGQGAETDAGIAALDAVRAHGRLLLGWQYAAGYEGALSGLRADESRGRAGNRAARGLAYQYQADGHWMVNPLSDWSARDVYALSLREGIPLHPHYRALYETLGESPESPASRVASALGPEAHSRRGRHAVVRVLYPALWRRLLQASPGLARDT